jgi:choloylglycine hydrolase
MCTAATYKTKDHYFGRNLDLEYSYHETVTITPRNYPFSFQRMGRLDTHYAMIGMAYVVEDYPLYYDATNEKGLSMAGLNFPGNAFYPPETPGRDNVSPFEFIPWILTQCATVAEAKALLGRINLMALPFSEQLPLSPLHWIIADRDGAIVVESMEDGLHLYDNPVGILTNNPPFPYQMTNLCNYRNLSRATPENTFAPALDLQPYSRGMGGLGLPGDLSSASRFVKAAFTKLNSLSGDSESASISQFFHILGSVDQQRGCCQLENGTFELTIYSSCCNTDRGIYYYTTYENSQITAVDMHHEDLDGSRPISYPLITGQQIRMQN